ncbi:MAG TPA: tetratricopeptide repeat protein [Xanthobacteraceae bacterium]
MRQPMAYSQWCHQTLWRTGFKQDNRIAAIRHARAAVTHGRDDAMALSLGAFVIGMVEHDRPAALDAFERAQTLSPSSAFALFTGGIVQAYAGNAERAMEWAERALRISPIDRLSYVAHHALAVGHFLRGQYDEAAHAARRAVQANPEFSVSHSLLAAALAELGQVEAAKAAANAGYGPPTLLHFARILRCRWRCTRPGQVINGGLAPGGPTPVGRAEAAAARRSLPPPPPCTFFDCDWPPASPVDARLCDAK